MKRGASVEFRRLQSGSCLKADSGAYVLNVEKIAIIAVVVGELRTSPPSPLSVYSEGGTKTDLSAGKTNSQ